MIDTDAPDVTPGCRTSGEPISLSDKNNSTVTGYEDLCITNGSLARYPSKDFDFVDGKVVCYECYQKFDSRSSYRVHIGTKTCAKPARLLRNLVYTKYKKTGSKKGTRGPAILSDIHVFQTRNRNYTNAMKSATAGGPKKQRNAPYKVPEKKPQPHNNTNGEPRKRGRPRKIKVESVQV